MIAEGKMGLVIGTTLKIQWQGFGSSLLFRVVLSQRKNVEIFHRNYFSLTPDRPIRESVMVVHATNLKMQDDCEFETRLGFIVRACFNK